MWAVGAVGEVGTLLCVVNAVKAQNHTKQEGAPPSFDPGRVGGYVFVYISILHLYNIYIYTYHVISKL